MNWIYHYQLFLFDFGGLLADTERLHYQAYVTMCARRGYCLDWSFPRYIAAAHCKATDLRDQIYAAFPTLQAEEPNWHILYEEKKRIFMDLIEKGTVPLMPGAVDLLQALEQAGIKRCVVTHSGRSLVARIREQNPILNTIPHWITRENYQEPKPDPECYRYAIATFSKPEDRIIGFEDSPRGLNALLGTHAKPVFVCPKDSVHVKSVISQYSHVLYYPDLLAIQDGNSP